jgi:hypothetical protein
MFYFDFANYFKMVGLAWNETSQKARVYYLLVLLVAVPIVSSFHAVCFLLDRVFFPGLSKVQVKEPVFIVGHARSGTTLTHRLMTEDEGRYSFFLLWECYFPSLLQKKIIRAAESIDRRLFGGLAARQVAKFEERRYGAMRHIHEMGLTIPEEDDIALYYSMASGFWITKMPYMGDLDFYRMGDWPEAKRRGYNDFYREVVKRQLYLNGPEKTHLAKNPLWAGRVASLIEAFPDAKFVVNVRDPRETIPSLLKLLTSAWKALEWDPQRQQRCLEVMVETSFDSYNHPIDALAASPATKSAIVDYRELTTDPAAAIERLYTELDLPLSAAYREILSQKGKRERKHKTHHSYSLEEFGLEADAIRANLAELFDRFQWEVDEGPPSAEGEVG